MTVQVKICGLTRAQDALLALDLGASYLGVILTTRSPRHVPLEQAVGLVATIRIAAPTARIVGVFTDEDPAVISRAHGLLGLHAVQVHADPEPVARELGYGTTWPALGIRGAVDAATIAAFHPHYAAVVADAFSASQAGGTGKVFDHRHVQPLFPSRRILLAGGLKPENFEDVCSRLEPGPFPYAFDLSSGVEASPGVKDPTRLRAFFDRFHARFPGGAGA